MDLAEYSKHLIQCILYHHPDPYKCLVWAHSNFHCLFDQIGPQQIEALYQYAKFQFECGNYSGAADFLYQYRALCTNSDRSLSALWGKLAAEILMQNWDIALEELNRLKDIIDSKACFFLLICLFFGV